MDQLLNKIENTFLLKFSQILKKLRKVIKLGKMLLIKLVTDYFFGKFFLEFLGNC